MVMLVGANLLWPGLGNLLIGDSNGWAYGVIYWLVAAISLFTFGIPALIYFIIACVTGREFLKRQLQPQTVAVPTPAAHIFCTKCGTEGIAEKNFCTKCGNSLP
jgi:hypothetical protein